ncbi:MAG: hypothetical protein FWF72_05685 [Paludibacter sp.]|nr:hypothetical protein [Paludibacter sp.]
MEKVTFKLEQIMTVSTTVWFFGAGLIIVIGYFGVKIYLGDILKIFSNSMTALSIATGIMLLGLGYLKKFNEKRKVIIEITDKQDIVCIRNCYLELPMSSFNYLMQLYFAKIVKKVNLFFRICNPEIMNISICNAAKRVYFTSRFFPFHPFSLSSFRAFYLFGVCLKNLSSL